MSIDIPFYDFVYKYQNSKLYYCIRFADETHKNKLQPHFYICVPNKIKNSFLLAMITSYKHFNNRKKFYSTNIKAVESLVVVEQHELCFLSHDSMIDCNKAELLTSDELMNRCSTDFERRVICNDDDIPYEVKVKITNGIINSPLIRQFIKKSILLIN
ncbi:MAG: hypothetical protein ACTSUL_01170 [Promethearchaeota archaeon]